MAAPAAMALWDTQALRTALVELADNPEGRDAARIANMEDVAAASAAESPKSAPGEQHQPFWAKLRLELDDVINSVRDRAAQLAKRYRPGTPGSPLADTNEWAELVGEWSSAMEFFAESARALVLAESPPNDEDPQPSLSRRCRRAVAVMERVGDAWDDLQELAVGAPLPQLAELFEPVTSSQKGWRAYYWRTYFDILAAACEFAQKDLGLEKADLHSWVERAMLRDSADSMLPACEAELAAAKAAGRPAARCIAFMSVRLVVQNRLADAQTQATARRAEVKPDAEHVKRTFRAATYGTTDDAEVLTNQDLSKLFGRVDANKSGSIDFNELVSAARRIGRHKISEEDMAVIFKQIDTDGDGLISVEEFSSWCAQDAAADAPPAGAPPPPTGPPAFVVPLLSSDARSRRRGRKDKDDGRAAKQPKKKTPSPYGEIGGAMARVDALSKRAGGHVGFNANMLRAELIEKRLAAAKASSEVKVAKVRHAQRYAPSPPNIISALQQRLACTGVTTSVSGPTLGIDRRKNRRDARRRSRYGTLSLAALFQHHD